jgi:hypothetical protein
VGYPDQFDGVLYDLANNAEKIQGGAQLGQSIFIYKTNSITECQPTGNADDPMQFYQDKIISAGTPSIKTVQDIGNTHIFLGFDNIYLFNGAAVQPLNKGLERYIIKLADKNYLNRSFSFILQEENLYCLAICAESASPDLFFVYNYMAGGWSIWDLQHAERDFLMTSAGDYKPMDAKTWLEALADNNYTYNHLLETNYSYLDLLQMGSLIPLLGSLGGRVYDFYTYNDDDGEPFDCSITTKDFPLNDPKHVFMLLEVTIASLAKGAVLLEASVDYGETWHAITRDYPNDAYEEGIYNYLLRGKQTRLRMSSVAGGRFEIESEIIGFNSTELEVEK